jgi:hypothetical protein
VREQARQFASPTAWLTVGAVLLWGTVAYAQEAKIRATLSSDGPVWVGQEVILQVELLAPGYFDSAVSFDLPDPDGILLMPPATHPVVGSTTIDGIQYSVQQHELRAWPMRAGEQSIPAIPIRFSFKRMPLDTNTVPVTVTTPSFPLPVQLPPGAEDLGNIISARNLQVKEKWEPEPGAAQIMAGAALTRSIEFSASGVPGMVFPPFPAGQIDGLGIYPKRRLADQDDGDGLIGIRRDIITYVCKRPGQFTIPAVRYTWFDLDTKELRSTTFPARTLNVIANPDLASTGVASAAGTATTSGIAPGESGWRRVATVVSIPLLMLVLVLATLTNRRLRSSVKDALAPLRAVHLQSLNPTEKAKKTRTGF